MSTTLLTSYIVQAVGALITAVLFGVFSATYRKPFLLQWARSWSALCIMLSGAALGYAVTDSGPPTSFTRFSISAVTQAAAYFQVAWLLLGSAELVSPAFAERILRRRALIFGAAAVLGVAAVSLFASHPDPLGPRFFVRVGVRAGVVGIAFLLSAAAVLWPRPGESLRSLGRALVGGASAAYGVIQLHLLWSLMFDVADASSPGYTIFSGFIDFVLVFTIGLGVVIWLLEDEHKKAVQTSLQVAQMAFHDPLTGLPTRKLLLDHLSLAIQQARRDKTKLAIYFLDLDRFKNINDSLGHSVGDKVLQAVAARIKSALREADTVGRMGGDEFVVLTPDVNRVDDAVHIAQKIREATREPLRTDGQELFVSGSMGIAMYPEDGEDAETLLKNADTAMYRAKAHGSDMFQLYTPEMNAHAVEQLALESALRRAVEAKEFELHFQPIVRTSDESVIALESMLRWRHPVLGLVRPEQFLRLAESSGLIVPIGDWAMRAACMQLAELRSAGYTELRMAVNISGRQLKQPDFADRIRVILAETAIPGNALEIEITEMSATQSEPAIIERLRTLRAIGVRVSIDDFGTGFSSVSVLRIFPVDSLKIDTSFVRDLVLDPNDAAIARAVIALAKSLGLTVIAEGVENPAQLEFLREQGCEAWQGYLYCPPVMAADVRGVLGRRSGSVRRTPGAADAEPIKG